ncbi:rod-binding protein [Vogesella facilis]|uniref:Rod-binding protein n=1 Tax=Vogesella facilis TaxID=1655232 RepID=A0ABV7RGU6_9NEIS
MNTTFPGGLAANEQLPAGDEASPAAANPEYRQRLESAAVKFEGMFIQQLLQEMRKGGEAFSAEDSIFNNRRERDMLDFADKQVADSLASQRAFGIADMIVRQMLPPAPSGKDG